MSPSLSNRKPKSRSRKVKGSDRPLRGWRILVTRARKQAGTLSGRLRALGATVVEIPSIEIRPPRSWKPLDSALAKLAGYDWLILTSVNGVEALFGRVKRVGLTKRATLHALKGHDFSRADNAPRNQGALAPEFQATLAHLNILAIGPATKAAIEARGLRVRLMPKQYVAESVVRALRSKVKGKRVLLVRARVARDVIPADLRKAGAHVDVVEAYETVVPSRSRQRLRALLRGPARRPHAITFTSSSTARNFLQLLGGNRADRKLLDDVVLASIGPVTSATLHEIGLRADVQAAEFTMDGLVRALVKAAKSQRA